MIFLKICRTFLDDTQVQYAPELFTYIKIHIDRYHNPGDFWMIGSQIFRLMRGVQESLARRVALLHPYSNNVLKRTPKTPKLYFYDTGLVCYLTRWSSPEVAESGAMNGALLENFTISEIVKSYQNAGLEPYLYFYRDRDAKEIDAILEADGKLCPLEIKKTAKPDKRLTCVFGVIDKSPSDSEQALSSAWQINSALLTAII